MKRYYQVYAEAPNLVEFFGLENEQREHYVPLNIKDFYGMIFNAINWLDATIVEFSADHKQYKIILDGIDGEEVAAELKFTSFTHFNEPYPNSFWMHVSSEVEGVAKQVFNWITTAVKNQYKEKAEERKGGSQ